MYELKPIRRDAVPAALEKAERYRLLNQPRQAESICRDILAADPGNQAATITLVLALTDQFATGTGPDMQLVHEALEGVRGDYERAYYQGVVDERRGKSMLRGSGPVEAGVSWLQRAMAHFEAAAGASPAGNDDAVLRWNSCARLLNRLESRGPLAAHADDALLVDDIPQR